MLARKDFETAFAKGELEYLKSLNSRAAEKQRCLPWAILAHALSGDLSAAQWHNEHIEKRDLKLNPVERALIDFAMGVGLTRISEYKRARAHFIAGVKYRHSGPKAEFFMRQGLGFFRYFTGSLTKSRAHAEKALGIATAEGFVFGQLIAEELMAHALIESGKIGRGLLHMRRALKRAVVCDHTILKQSFRLALKLNQARFGLRWDGVVLLEKALLQLHPKDSYSRNAVKLELANQWVLRGGAEQALQTLTEACESIYASQNRRQIAQLNFQLAFVTWLRGRGDEALHLLRAAGLQLHTDVDVVLQKKMHGLFERIASGDTLSSRPQPLVYGEDRLGDLYSQVLKGDSRALRMILQHQLYYLLYPYFKLQFAQRALLFDLLPKGLIIVDQGNIRVIERGFSRTLRRVLEALALSHQSKADLVLGVWGYEYDPSRHDSLVYSSISKIRGLLRNNWIEMDEKGYRLQSGVKLQTLTSQPVDEVAPAAVQMPIEKLSLNFRQLKILSGLDSHKAEIVDVAGVVDEFGISRASATRDLSELTARGFLSRMGRARGTVYVRTGKSWRKDRL